MPRVNKHFLRYLPLLLWVGLGACSARQGQQLLKNGYVKPGPSQTVLSTAPHDSIVLHYWGCGGFYIRYGSEALLVDPFASNPRLGARLQTDTHAVDLLMQHAAGWPKKQTDIRAVLCTHAHYDHLMDTPYLMDRWLTETTVFAGNNTANHLMWASGRPKHRPYINLDAGNGPFAVGERIRVTPLLLSHPPHIGQIKLYGGEFKANAKPGQAKFWQCGQTYGFILDFMDKNGTIACRIYLQTSSGLLGLDNIPPHTATGHAVDLMILPAALYSKVSGYPQRLLDKYRPKHVLVCHWENFFKPMAKVRQKPYTVSLSNVPRFARELDTQIGREHFTVPMPDTRFVVKF